VAVAPTKKQRGMWSKIAELGCAVSGCDRHDITIHHCGTGGGGRKNHDYVIGLCRYHHQGAMGIDRREYGASEEVIDWEGLFGTERELFEKAMSLLNLP